jgi:transposase
MAYIYGQRSQYSLFPKSIDEYVGEHDPVRVYDALVNELDFKELGISLDPYKGGPDEYDPKTMLKIIVYGYALSQRSSRKLELACHRDISFVWLTGGLAPDYRTIARFRKDYAEAIRKVLKQIVRLCVKWDLIEGNALFIDSTVMNANASVRKSFTPENSKERLAKLDAHIDRLLKETARLDQEQDPQGSLVKVKEDLLDLQKIRADIQAVSDELKEKDLTELNTTDRDSVRVNNSGRCRAGYRAQMSADGKHGLIVDTDVLASSTDANKLSGEFGRSVDALEKVPAFTASDSGYCSAPDVAKIVDKTTVVMPTQQQVDKERSDKKNPAEKAFTKEAFTYDFASDTYTCPAGQKLVLKFCSTDKKGNNQKNYRTQDRETCKACPHFGQCTTDKDNGRKIVRDEFEHVRERLKATYETPEGKEIYRQRKIFAELPFAGIKHNGGIRRFLLRGLAGVNAEFALLACGHNVTRMITLLGAAGFLAKIQGV